MADRIRIKKEKGLALVPGANKLSGGYNFAVEVPEGVGASLALYKKRARKPSDSFYRRGQSGKYLCIYTSGI